jgi:hypothetical protein
LGQTLPSHEDCQKGSEVKELNRVSTGAPEHVWDRWNFGQRACGTQHC